MSIPQESPSDRDEEEQVPVRESQPDTHHPYAPSHELFDISTTVDPSYIIALIRKLLPANVKDRQMSIGYDAHSSSSEGPKTVDLKIDTSSRPENGGDKRWSVGESESMDTVEICSEADNLLSNGDEVVAGEEAWEEFGCILWDLAASKTHAEFMVQNLALEVLLATLTVSKSARITEIILGIIGNLACHDVSRKNVASTNGLIGMVLEQLFLDDTQCLSEACRLITLFLQSDESICLAEALQSEHILCRILWIVENTLNLHLLEKSIDLLLAITESKQEVVAILLPPLIKLGFSQVLVDLLSLEISKLMEERLPERYPVLELILQTVEALSVIDDHSQEICSNNEVFRLLTVLIKFPDKAEVANSCVTASVLIANILTDAADLTSEILKDLFFLQGLLDVFPFASDDIEARSALWSVLARLLVRIQKTEMSPSQLHQYVLVLTSKLEVIEDELLNYNVDDSNEEHGSSSSLKFSARIFALNGIAELLSQWRTLEDRMKDTLSMEGYYVNEGDIDKMLDCCRKYVKSTAGEDMNTPIIDKS